MVFINTTYQYKANTAAYSSSCSNRYNVILTTTNLIVSLGSVSYLDEVSQCLLMKKYKNISTYLSIIYNEKKL